VGRRTACTATDGTVRGGPQRPTCAGSPTASDRRARRRDETGITGRRPALTRAAFTRRILARTLACSAAWCEPSARFSNRRSLASAFSAVDDVGPVASRSSAGDGVGDPDAAGSPAANEAAATTAIGPATRGRAPSFRGPARPR
jgi:hypothetical protein